jgi:hypothetical protein
MQLAERTDYERFLEAFISRYKEELKYVELVPEIDMFLLYLEFKGSGKTPEQWLEKEEMS